ncbi:MAG: hypothetical protein D6830_04255 [Ignavibacteria bacterium]|nr:MAG: hypothetical protein D6830_04255 [Ignavibacteria bacterium]
MNRELILKYLSGLLNDSEKIEFEKRLESDPGLKKEFMSIYGKLEGLQQFSDVEVDQTYFNNLQVKVRSRMENSSRINWVPRISFALSLVLVAYIFLFTGKSNNQFVVNLEKELSGDSNYTAMLDKYFDNPVEEEVLYLSIANSDTKAFDLENNEIQADEDYLKYNILNEINSSEIDEYLGDEDLSNLEKQISGIKF